MNLFNQIKSTLHNYEYSTELFIFHEELKITYLLNLLSLNPDDGWLSGVMGLYYDPDFVKVTT